MKKQPLTLHIEFNVPVDRLGLFTELFQNEVSDLKITQNNAGVYAVTQSPKRGTKHTTKRRSPGRDAAMELVHSVGIGGKILSREDGNLGTALAKIDLRPTSASPIASWLNSQGYTKYVGPSTYEVVKLPA